MSKTLIVSSVALLIGIAVGTGWPYIQSQVWPASASMEQVATTDEQKPLFYRNPMNPAITSPVPAQDEMGMDYIPVYPDKPAAEKKPVFYRNPMNPAITSPVPAQDEMGMEYIPVYADNNAGNSSDEPSGTVTIDPVIVQNIGVRIAKVEQRDLVRSIRANGRITVDESRMAKIHPRTEGWIEQQFVSRIGEEVHQGDELLTLYSPQLVTSQQEYLLAVVNLAKLKDSTFKDIRVGAEEMLASSEERLRLLNMSAGQIATLRNTQTVMQAVAIESPFDGVVLNIDAREGQYIMPNTELYMLADLSKVWLLADVFEYELPWISVGDSASMSITALDNQTFTGTVSYIYPYAEPTTRTVKVRVEFDNSEGLLKPETFASVTIGASSRKQALVVPSEAIVRSGSREQVFVVRGEGKFEPRKVTLGYSSDGWVEVKTGLKAGESIVSSALFLIDSESKLREATAKMMEASKDNDASRSGILSGELSMEGMSMNDLSMDDISMDELSMDGMSLEPSLNEPPTPPSSADGVMKHD